MLLNKTSLALITGLTLASASAIASSPTPAPTDGHDKDRVELRCQFSGAFTGKTGTGVLGCRAEAVISRVDEHIDFKWLFGQQGDFFRVRCDGLDLDDHDDIPGGDGVIYGLTPSALGLGRVDTLITGQRTVSPLMRVLDFDFNRKRGDDDDRDDRDRRNATLSITRLGVSVVIPGVCEIDRHEHEHEPSAPIAPPVR